MSYDADSLPLTSPFVPEPQHYRRGDGGCIIRCSSHNKGERLPRAPHKGWEHQARSKYQPHVGAKQRRKQMLAGL